MFGRARLEHMARPCSVCNRPDVRRIHSAILSGRSRRSVAAEFGIHHATLDRHWWHCVPDDLRAAINGDQEMTADALDGYALIDAMSQLVAKAGDLFARLEADYHAGNMKDARSLVSALRECRSALEGLAKLSFAVQDRTPDAGDESERPEIDALILAELAKRGHVVTEPVATAPLAITTGL